VRLRFEVFYFGVVFTFLFKFFKTLITIKIFHPHSNRHKRKHNSVDASGNACYNTTDSTEDITKQKSAQSNSQVHTTQEAKSGSKPNRPKRKGA